MALPPSQNEKSGGFFSPQQNPAWREDMSQKEAVPGQGAAIQSPVTDQTKMPYAGDASQKVALDAEYGEARAPEVVSYAPYYSPSPYTDPSIDPRSIDPRSPAWNSERAALPGTDMPTATQKRSKRIRIAVGVIVVLVIIGAVLGGVLGTRASRNSDDPTKTPSASNGTDRNPQSALRAIDRTGIATTALADGTGMLLYYQAANGSIIETFTPQKSLSTTSNPPQYRIQSSSLVPIRDISLASPLAAVSFTANNTLWKMLIYVNSDLRLMQINAQGSREWGDPTMISPSAANERLYSGSSGITACASDTGGFYGARVYFSQRDNYVEELWWNWRTPGPKDVGLPWNRGQGFPGADARAGTGCSAIQSGNDTFVNVYMRNATTKGLEHWYFKLYGSGRRDPWTRVEETNVARDPAFAIANASSVAVVTDAEQKTQYVFYEGTDGDLKMVSAETGTPPARAAGQFFSYGDVSDRRLAAYFVDGAPMVLAQRVGGELGGLRVARQGSVLGNGTVVG